MPTTQRTGGAAGTGTEPATGTDFGESADVGGGRHASAADLRRLVEECDAFSRCEDCGTHVVNLDSHRCSSSGDVRTNRETLRRRAEGDDRDDDDSVGIFPRSSGNSYAYHELREGEVCCGCGNYAKADRLEVVTRAEAKQRGRCPCGNCARLKRAQSDRDD